MRRLLLLVPLLSLLVACGGEPTVDGSSVQAFDASVERIRESLDERERLEFDSALTALTLEQLGNAVTAAFAGGEPKSEADRNAELRASLDGLTAEGVVAKAQPAREKLLQQK